MRNIKLDTLLLILMTIMFSSCSVVGGIFKTAMGVSIILVLIVIIAIVTVILKSSKK